MKKLLKNFFAKAQGALQRSTVAILCTLLIGFFMAAGCEEPTALNPTQSGDSALHTTEETTDTLTNIRYDPQQEQVCNVDNPLTELLWLAEFISGIEEDISLGYKHHARIYQCTYNENNIGFLMEPCVGCPDAGYNLVNCEGKILCTLWGFAGLNCEEFQIDFENKELIWEINN